MQNRYLHIPIGILLCCLTLHADAHECEVQNKQQLSLHFTSLPLITALQIIADFSGKELITKHAANMDISLHYNCTEWQNVIHDLNNRFALHIKVQGDKIILSDQ